MKSSVYCWVQNFQQRLYNYVWYLFFRYVIMGATSTEERQLSESYGYDADGSWLPRSPAAAFIAGGDWALEYPMPLPPKVHVRSKSIQSLIPGFYTSHLLPNTAAPPHLHATYASAACVWSCCTLWLSMHH